MRWVWLVLGLSGACLAQNLTVGPTTMDSGTVLYTATSTITNSSNAFVVDNSASVTFQAGSSITLLPGFQAIAGSGNPTFLAIINTGTSTTGISDTPPPVAKPSREYIYLNGQVVAIEQ